MSRLTSLSALVLFALLPCLLLVSRVPTAQAWGDVGHSLIGRIAMSQLTPATTALLVTLAPTNATVAAPRPDGPNPNATVAGNISDPGIGSWPDRVRSPNTTFYYTDSWHFFNTRDWQCYYNAATDCPATGCVNSAIANYTARTADASLGLQEQQYALAFLVHFTEDLHQPLHGGFASDQDGNSIRGGFNTASSTNANTNLHAMWDTTIINTRIGRDFNGSPDAYYQWLYSTLVTQYNESTAGWRSCNTAADYAACSADWSQESARLACSSAYTTPSGGRLTAASTLSPVSVASGGGEAYYQQTIPIIELRILQAGVRLANVLNNIAANNVNGGGSGGGGNNGGPTVVEDDSGYSSAAGGFMIFLIVLLLLSQLVCCGLYYRKEKNGLPGLFARSGGGGNMGLIGGGGSTSGMSSSLL